MKPSKVAKKLQLSLRHNARPLPLEVQVVSKAHAHVLHTAREAHINDTRLARRARRKKECAKRLAGRRSTEST